MPIERLGADDRIMLGVSRRWPQDIGALLMLEGSGGFRIERARAAIASKLHLAPPLRQRIMQPLRGRGGPLWVDDAGFDVADHVHELRLEAPVGEPELLAVVERLRHERLDLGRAPWAITFLTGLPDGRAAAFVKVHHSLADGLATMTLIGALLDREAGAAWQPAPAWVPRRPPVQSELVADNLRRRIAEIGSVMRAVVHPVRMLRRVARSLPAIWELLAERPATPTSVDRVIGLDRNLALARASYGTLRRVARRADATVNDVLLTVIAGGLRALLLSRGEAVEGVTLRAYVPVTLRTSWRGPQHGTQVSQMAVPLELADPDPVRRLRRIADQTERRKAKPRPDVGKLFRGRVMPALLLAAIIRQRVNITTASIPGPKRPRYLAGMRVLEVFPIVPLLGNQPLGVAAVSYAGGLGIGITADRAAFPDLEAFAAAVRAELRALEAGDRPITAARIAMTAGWAGSGRARSAR